MFGWEQKVAGIGEWKIKIASTWHSKMQMLPLLSSLI